MITFGKVVLTIGLVIICSAFGDLGVLLIHDNHDLVGRIIIQASIIVQLIAFGHIWELT